MCAELLESGNKWLQSNQQLPLSTTVQGNRIRCHRFERTLAIGELHPAAVPAGFVRKCNQSTIMVNSARMPVVVRKQHSPHWGLLRANELPGSVGVTSIWPCQSDLWHGWSARSLDGSVGNHGRWVHVVVRPPLHLLLREGFAQATSWTSEWHETWIIQCRQHHASSSIYCFDLNRQQSIVDLNCTRINQSYELISLYTCRPSIRVLSQNFAHF